MLLTPTSVQLTLIHPMFTSRLVFSFFKTDSRLRQLRMALRQSLATFILRRTSLRQFMDQLLHSGVLLNLNNQHKARLHQP
jgi:hypothetical protein